MVRSSTRQSDSSTRNTCPIKRYRLTISGVLRMHPAKRRQVVRLLQTHIGSASGLHVTITPVVGE